MTNSEIIRGYIAYCFNFVPRFHTGRGDVPLAVFKLDHVKIEKINEANCINFDLVDENGITFERHDSFFDYAFDSFGFSDARINHIVMKGIISMKTGYVQLVDIFNGRWFYCMIPENIQTFDEYVEDLENLGLKEKPKGLLKIPAHMMVV